MSRSLTAVAIDGMPEVEPGDVLGELIARAAVAHGELVGEADVVVVAQKIVSKAEGQLRELADVVPGTRATALARELDRDPRLVELVLAESVRVVRAERAVLVVETHHGWVCANAGIDASNVAGAERVALLPRDPDASARRIRAELEAATGARPAVLISDSFGRPWRLGQTDVAIGCAGLDPLDDWRGMVDRQGRELSATAIAVADELAAAADLVRDKTTGVPVVVLRGAGEWVTAADGPGAGTLRRPAGEDLFR